MVANTAVFQPLGAYGKCGASLIAPYDISDVPRDALFMGIFSLSERLILEATCRRSTASNLFSVKALRLR